MRTPSCELKMGLKKGPWSGEEDHKLISYISRYGIWNWSHMPKFAGLSRSGKSCRLRWMNYLRPDVKKGNFTKEEEDIIIHSHSLLGNRWSAIASRLPGRTDNDIKNYWHTHLKKRGTRNLASERTKPNDSTSFESPYVNHETDITESRSSLAAEEDSSSSSCSNFLIDQMLDFKDDCYNIGSPGTVDDLHCFWNQLCTIENLELGSNYQHLFSGSVLQDAFDESISLYGFYNCQ